MAQIIKYKQGGPTQKYGTYTVDGVKHTVDDAFLEQLSSYGSQLRPDVGNQFQHIIDSLKSGEDISFTSSGDGTLYGNVSFDVTDNQTNRLKKSRRGIGRFFGSVNHGKEQDAREAISALKDFKYNKPSSDKNHYDWSKALDLEYKNSEDGKRTFIEGANNLQILNRLRSLKEVSGYSDNDIFSGYNKLDKSAYVDLYNRLGDDGIENLISRIENGTLTEEDAMALDDIGILSNLQSKGGEKIEEVGNKLTEKEIQDNLDPDSHSIAGLRVITNPDGTYSLDGIDGNQIFGGNRVYINDEVLRDKHQYDSLKGWFWFDGKLVPKSIAEDDNSVFYKNLDQWIYNNKNNIYNTNGIDVWGNSSNPFTNYDSTFFVPGLKNNNRGMMFRTMQDPNDSSSVIYEYYDKDSARDRYGFVTPEAVKRLRYNLNTGTTEELASTEGTSVNYEDITNPVTKWSERASGYYEINIPDGNGEITATIFRNPYDVNDVWFYRDGMQQPYQMTPDEVKAFTDAGMFSSNPENHMFNGSLSRQWQEYLSQNNQNFRGKTLSGQVLDALLLPFTTSARAMYTMKTPIVNGERWNRASRNIFNQSPKFQSGGRINAAKVSTVENDTTAKTATKRTDKESAKTSLSDNDFNDLTRADKIQIASIAGDVASLIASVPTGGNPVAGALGYGSSLAQFGADVSRDGFQLGDLGSLLVNAGLDTITLLPGVGITSKLAKIAKTVKKSASLLKNALMAYGAVNAVSAVNNIASGKGTLDDWKSLSTGLFAIKGIKNQLQNQRFLNRYTEYKGRSSKAEGKTTEQLRNEYVDKIVSNKNLGMHDGKPTRWANPDGTVKDYKQAIEDLTESGHLKITKTQEAKWAAESAKSKASASASNAFSGSYNPFSSNYRFRASNRTLSDGFDLRSLSGNTSELRTLGRIVRTNPEIARQLQNQGWLLPSTLNFRSNYGGSSFYRSPIFRRFSGFRTMPIALPESSGIRDIPVTLSRRKNPTEIINIDPYIQSIDDYIGLRFHKKGGKIVKARFGDKVTPWYGMNFQIDGMSTPVVATAKAMSNRPEINFGVSKMSSEIDPNIKSSAALLAKAQNNANEERLSSLSQTNVSSSENGLKGSSGSGFRSFLKNINPDMIMGLTDFLISRGTINRIADKQKDAIRKGMLGSQQQMPTEFYSKFSDNGLHRMYDNRIRNIRQYKTSNSDPRLVMAERLVRDMNVDQLEGERDTKFSQMIDQYNDKLLTQKQQYANLRTQIANENRNRWSQGLANLDMVEANRIGQQTQNSKNLIYQFRQNYAKDLQDRLSQEEVLNRMNADTKYQNQLKELFESYGGFDAMSKEDSERWGNDWLGYLSYSKPDEVTNIRNKNYFDIYQNMINDPRRRRSWINLLGNSNISMYQNQIMPQQKTTTFFRKKGGKVQRFRDVDEQAYLDQQKAINKAINDLNNNIIKLFLKMMS